MCIIIVNKSSLLDKKTLQICFENNPDAMGLMYANRGKVKIFKELVNFDKFYSVYCNVRKNKDIGNIVLHFRIGTSGNQDLTNCHPFRVNNNLAFCHNGIINEYSFKKSDFSDTVLFNESILKKLPFNFLSNRPIVKLLDKYCTGSKLVFLDNFGTVSFVNEKSGHWVKDNWFSNNGYKIEPISTYSLNWLKWDEYTTIEMDNECEYCGGNIYSEYEKKHGMCSECMRLFEESEEDKFFANN
jgi:predicted glutamine amidotransferase